MVTKAGAFALIFATAVTTPAARAQSASGGAEVVMQALGFLGAPYRLGGDDPARGFDCSGLVRHVFRQALSIELPRRSDAMSDIGRSVAADALVTGDLLFFNTLGKPFSHVALYIGDGRFVHAPAHGGQVRVESMQFDYWRTRFDGARRVAPDSGAGSGSAAAAREVAMSGAAARVVDWGASDAKP